MAPPSSSSSASPARPGLPSRSSTRRDDELNAAFDQASDNLPGYDELAGSSSSGVADSVAINMSSDVFFDAGDALPQEPPASPPVNDPLGVNANAASSSSSPNSYHPPPTFPPPRTQPGSGYDFERPSYFPSATRRPQAQASSTTQAPRVPSSMSSGAADASADRSNDDDDDDDDDEAGELHLGFAEGGQSRSSGNGQYGLIGGDHQLSRVERIRFAMGRFGRLVGMGIPGARYAAVSQGANGRVGSSSARRPRVMGGGTNQDGVFANLNAKPERPRRQRGNGPDDRGDDDDLAEEALPPTYEVAAADAAPPYWETTILGTASGLHPLAGGLGWTPGGAHVGAIEDLIVDGLPVGNFFGFAWNMLVSMTFQFVGFLLTYLLHTTHAARFGSRSGLGITLIQYGFYLRTRASEIAEGKPGSDADPFQGVWFGETDPTESGAGRRRSLVGMVARSLMSRAETTAAVGGSSLADAFAAQGDASFGDATQNFQQSMSASTEWLSYILMVIGWFILLSSLLSYWRIHRWGQSLVDAAHREQRSNEAENGGGEQEERPPVGFVHRLRAAFSDGSASRRQHSAEDWIIFPGMGQRLGSRHESGRVSSSLRDLEDPDGLDAEEAELNETERRLLHEMRSVGLLS